MARTKPFLLGALAYAGVTFPLAYVWHLVAFADLYDRLHFTTLPEPIIPLGFVTIVFQGFLLSAVFPRFRRGNPVRDGMVFGLVVGAFIWSAATVAHAAKHDVGSPIAFLLMEAAYFSVNFVVYGVLLGLIWRQEPHGV